MLVVAWGTVNKDRVNLHEASVDHSLSIQHTTKYVYDNPTVMGGACIHGAFFSLLMIIEANFRESD